MNLISKTYWIAKGVGWDNVPRRVYQSFLTRSGMLEQRLAPELFSVDHFPLKDFDNRRRLDAWKERKSRFFNLPTSTQLRRLVCPETWQQCVTQVCDRALLGKYPMFSRWEGELGWPPDFNRDPLNNVDWPVGEHWLRTARSGPPRNDIKLVWEASRFSLAYYLAREFVYSGDPRWAAAFWQLLEAWIAQNPPNQSVAWGCGQEVSFRLMAALTAAIAMLESEHSSADRLALLELLCWQSAKRVEANINYAISQENNHGLSEAVGLWTVALLFPEFPESARWLNTARRVLESEIKRQVYADGSYVQHSMSYHRVMLDDMSWAVALGRINHQSLSRELVARVASGVTWLSELIDPSSGRVPNYGANDGANVLPLACCDYLDFRPVLQAAAAVCEVDVPLQEGHWSEKSLWLAGRIPGKSKASAAARWEAPLGGYYLLRGPNSRLMIRAATYHDRPSQCDALHVDLWYHGVNVLRDAGSYRYYHEDAATIQYFYSVAAHNTVQFSGVEQMVKGPNFLWFHWPTAEATWKSAEELECKASFAGELPYVHRRNVQRCGDRYAIEDTVNDGSQFVSRWRLAPELQWTQSGPMSFHASLENVTLSITFQSKADSMRATLEQGWESLYYGERNMVPVIQLTGVTGALLTTIGPAVSKDVPAGRSDEHRSEISG